MICTEVLIWWTLSDQSGQNNIQESFKTLCFYMNRESICIKESAKASLSHPPQSLHRFFLKKRKEL